MHRAYQPYTPVNNVFLKQKWDKNVYQIHRRKVHAAKAVIDTCSPKVHQHLIVKLKKLHEESVRNAIIQRDNKLLSSKMDHIMRTGGYTDHRNGYISKSLNDAKHKRELVRVAMENSMMLKRLKAREANYNYNQLIGDWKESRRYLLNISKYPPPSYALNMPTKIIDLSTDTETAAEKTTTTAETPTPPEATEEPTTESQEIPTSESNTNNNNLDFFIVICHHLL